MKYGAHDTPVISGGSLKLHGVEIRVAARVFHVSFAVCGSHRGIDDRIECLAGLGRPRNLQQAWWFSARGPQGA